MTNDEAVTHEELDTAIERIRTVLREYPWHIGRSGRIRATLLEETHEQDEETVCPIAMLSMHTSDQQIETVLANPAHQRWAERMEETVRTGGRRARRGDRRGQQQRTTHRQERAPTVRSRAPDQRRAEERRSR